MVRVEAAVPGIIVAPMHVSILVKEWVIKVITPIEHLLIRVIVVITKVVVPTLHLIIIVEAGIVKVISPEVVIGTRHEDLYAEVKED